MTSSAPTHAPPPPPPSLRPLSLSEDSDNSRAIAQPPATQFSHFYNKRLDGAAPSSLLAPSGKTSSNTAPPHPSTPSPPPSYHDTPAATIRLLRPSDERAPPPPPKIPPPPVSAAVAPPATIPEEPRSMLSPPLPPKLVKAQAAQPNVLTRGRPRDERSELPDPVRKDAVSVPLRLHKSPTRGISPSGDEQPRGRHTLARPPNAAASQQFQPHAPQHAHTQPQLGYVASVSTGQSSRSHSTHSSDGGSAQGLNEATTAQRRRSWLPGSAGGRGNRLRSKSHQPYAGTHSTAWVLSTDSHADYNVDYLTNGDKVPELWDDNGTLYVYLAPPQSGKGPSFKVRPSVIEQSRVLSSLVQSRVSSPASARSRARSFSGRDTLMAADAQRVSSPPMSPPQFPSSESHLYLPVGKIGGTADLERLIALRNLFALLTGQPLVATRNFSTFFAALTQVAGLLREFEFGSASGGSNSFGEAVDLSIGFYIEQNGVADVRYSREKTLEALVLAEQLRFWPLYNEAFCHAVGKYPALRDLKASPLWDQVSTNTRQRLERAHLDLVTRQHSVNTRLEQFEFPSLFAGVASSTSNPDYRHIRFKNWRASFAEMRSFVLKYYKTQFGSWPPKASSRRNPFSESGLNRLVLKTLYADLCSVYDLLVDRSSITTRVGEDSVIPGLPAPGSASTSASAPGSAKASTPSSPTDAYRTALRQVLGEFDQSSPPVLPPIPFDVPKLPTMATIHETYPDMAPKDQARFDKGVQQYELQLVLLKSHNVDAERPGESPFLAAFEAFEFREAKKGKSEAELAEMRVGHWLFLYVVLQSMPMLVIDAPGLRFADGVEYFLCEPPQGRPPWVEDAGEVRKAWFQTAGGAGPLVELSADVLLYSVEATYHRSHCWLAAKKWDAEAARGSISSMGVAPDDLVIVQGSEGIAAAAAAGVPFPIQSVTLPDIPTGAASRISSSSNSLANMPVSISDAVVAAATSAASSPRVLPAANSEHAENAPSTRSISPAMAAQNQGQNSPPLPPSLNLPWPRQRDNYDELQQRAHLRHASIGWALEPVNMGEDGRVQSSHPHSGDGAAPNTRRIASAGNLRAMADASGNANSNQTPRAVSGGNRDFFNSESTFDAILGSMDTDQATKKSKKRNSFLPFK